MILPTEAELLEVFEAVPTVLDAGVPWAYNSLSFEVRIPAGQLRVTVVPGFGQVAMLVTGGAVHLELALEDVLELRRLDGDALLIRVNGGAELQLRLRPRLELRGGLSWEHGRYWARQ